MFPDEHNFLNEYTSPEISSLKECFANGPAERRVKDASAVLKHFSGFSVHDFELSRYDKNINLEPEVVFIRALLNSVPLRRAGPPHLGHAV